MAETLKLGEISKSIKITNKDIIARLAEFGVELKSSSSVINEDVAGLILDIYTQANSVTEEELQELKAEAEKKAGKKEETAETPVKTEETTSEKKEKPEEKKAEEKKPVKEEPKKVEEKPKHEKHKKVAKKQSGQKIDLSNVDHSNTEEEYIVKTEERKRHVDTRQTVVNLDAIETRERIEDMVPDHIKMDKKGGKVKNNKKGAPNIKNRREKEKPQPKKEIKAKVITEIEIPETITVGEFA
ncbi:MAG: hypothetical protein HFE52_05640, partial [Clostridia bacterium]|nr:hypothetical protein [Clostridia bacterium]